MNVKLLYYNSDCEKIIASAAKLCYSSASVDDILKKESESDSAKFVEMLRTLGHESPIEHATFTFGVEQVSRSLLAQITRHRIASFSVQSQRYVLEKEFSFVIPPEINDDKEAKDIFLKFMDITKKNYDCLFEILKNKHKFRLINNGYTDKEAEKKAEKLSCEDARFVLPNACCCKFIVTMNARSLLNFFKLRCCNRAQWEIRELAFKMLELVAKVSPTVFKNAGPNCVRNGCTEGKMSCKKAEEVRRRVRKIFEDSKES